MLSFAGVKEGRFDRLHAVVEADAEVSTQQFVERLVLEIVCREARDEGGGDVEFFEGDRFIIGQTQAQDRDGLIAFSDVELASDVRSRLGGVEAEDMRTGAHAAGEHVFGEGARGQRLVELRAEGEDARAVTPADHAFGDEFVDGAAQGHPRDAEALGELSFRRELFTGGHALEAVEELVAYGVEFRHDTIEAQDTPLNQDHWSILLRSRIRKPGVHGCPCGAYHEAMTAFTGQELTDTLNDKGLTDWKPQGDAIGTRLLTGDFATGLDLVNKIGAAAEEAGHHPDITLTFPHVDIQLTSHDTGAVTERDLDLAGTISKLAASAGVKADPNAD